MGISIEHTNLRQYGSPLSNTQIRNLLKDLSTAIGNAFKIPANDFSLKETNDGIMLLFQTLPPDKERETVDFIKARLREWNYSSFDSTKSLRKIFLITSDNQSKSSEKKMKSLKAAFEVAYGAIDDFHVRFTVRFTNPFTLEIETKHPNEDLVLLENVIKARIRGLNMPSSTKVEGPVQAI